MPIFHLQPVKNVPGKRKAVNTQNFETFECIDDNAEWSEILEEKFGVSSEDRVQEDVYVTSKRNGWRGNLSQTPKPTVKSGRMKDPAAKIHVNVWNLRMPENRVTENGDTQVLMPPPPPLQPIAGFSGYALPPPTPRQYLVNLLREEGINHYPETARKIKKSVRNRVDDLTILRGLHEYQNMHRNDLKWAKFRQYCPINIREIIDQMYRDMPRA